MKIPKNKTLNPLDKILEGSNKGQKNAILHDTGPMLVIAGAGTGKTSVITKRIACLIASKKAKPSEILALTFTDKASVEMEERVDILVPYGFNDVRISTFHAFGDSIIRENAYVLGINPNYHLLNQSESAVFFKQHIFKFPLKHFRSLSNPAMHIRAILSAFSRLKDENISSEEYVNYAENAIKNASSEEEKDSAEKHLETAKTYQKYESLKRENNYLDFGDQVVSSLQILKENPSILDKHRNKFKYILVDEFQDTNYTQFELVKLLSEVHRNITVVGDDDQSIYKFRGACLSNILSFKDTYPDAKQIVLKENYRSTQSILDSSYRLIAQNNPERLEVKNNINKKLISKRNKGTEVAHLHFDSLSTEADMVAGKIKELKNTKGCQYNDFAVLVRANDSAIPFIKSLNMLSIPWRFSGEQGLYQRPEIRLILSFLRVMSNPEDSLSLYYFMSSEIYDFDPPDLALLNYVSSHYKRSLMNVLKNISPYEELIQLSGKTKAETEKIITDLKYYYEESQKSKTGVLLYNFLKKTEFLNRLYNAKSFEDVEMAQNIAKFFSIISSYSEIAKYDRVNMFVEHIDSLISVGDDPSVAQSDFDADAVSVLTVHKAKGLEFPVVFIVSVVQDRFPSRNRKDLIDVPRELIKDILTEGDYHLQEERRLFYVAMTRAKDELYITSARDYGGKRLKKISRFILEALDKPKADSEALKMSPKEIIERYAPLDAKKRGDYLPSIHKDILRLSPYAIDDYLTCPLKYKYVHILRIPIIRHHTLVFGEVVHKVLNEYFKFKKEGKSINKDEFLKIYDTLWSSAGFISREHEDERFRQGRVSLEKYFEKQEKSGIVPFSVEEDFKFMLDKNLKITGRWDRLDERASSLVSEQRTLNPELPQRVIVDFKTTAKVKTQKDADKEIKQSKQLIIYALGHKMKYGKLPDSVELHFLEPGLESNMEITEKMVEDVTDKIMEVKAGILKGDFKAKPAFMACQYCAYSNICPAVER